jgi:hypothetical protein
MVAMSRWLNTAAGRRVWPGSGGVPLGGYVQAGAVEIPLERLARGDVLQRVNPSKPESWTGAHTMVVLAVDANDPMRVTVAESNHDWNGSMQRREVLLPDDSRPGMKWTAWRFGQRP